MIAFGLLKFKSQNKPTVWHFISDKPDNSNLSVWFFEFFGQQSKAAIGTVWSDSIVNYAFEIEFQSHYALL